MTRKAAGSPRGGWRVEGARAPTSKAASGRKGAAARGLLGKKARAREAAISELYPLLGGGVDDTDPEAHLYRALGQGPRDLPSYTHERQIELSFGMHLTDPLANRINTIKRDYTIAGGLTFKIEQSEAEKDAEAAAKAKAAAAKAAAAPPVLVPGQAPGQPAPNDPRAQESATPCDAEGRALCAPCNRSGVGVEIQPGERCDRCGVIGWVRATAADAPDNASEKKAAASAEPSSDELREILAEHWNDPDNLWELKQSDRALALGIWGEQLWPAFVNPATGHVKIGSVDPRRVKEVRTDPENHERVTEIALKDTAGRPGRVYKAITVAEDEDLDGDGTRGYLVGERLGEPHAAFYFAVNKVQGARRGHSDNLPLLDWIDAYGQLLFDGIDNAKLKNSFIWDVLLKGATEAQIGAWLKRHRSPPKPGAIRAHNENVTWTAVGPELQALQLAEFARIYRVHILGGAGLPEHWFGEGGETNRATSKEMGQPVLLGLKGRQRLFCYMVQTVLRFAVDQAILAGRIKGTPKTKVRVTVTAPEFEQRDVATGATALANATNALAVAEDRKWITTDAARKVFCQVAEALGVKIDAEAEREAVEQAIEAEGKERAATLGAENAALRQIVAKGAGSRGTLPPKVGEEDEA